MATKAAKLLCQWTFDVLGLERITLKTHVDNLRSQMVAKRVGFERMEDKNKSEAQPESLWFVLSNR
jgi:RimJ/RimL family protein N-acetyltransferase